MIFEIDDNVPVPIPNCDRNYDYLKEFAFKKGKEPWNKGKRTGHIPWNKGQKNFDVKAYMNEYYKEYYIKNKEEICNKTRKYKLDNIDEWRKYDREYKKKHEKIINEKRKKYLNSGTLAAKRSLIAKRLRNRLWAAIKNKQKRGSAVKDLGCTLDEFIEYIENKFIKGMSWKNRKLWHLDHIKPLSKFDLEDINQFKEACHYTNLQPLWAKDNLIKHDRY